ncbi:hypothetical protein ROZALSC1DRAFT_30771 [Rozella allomycis CSF55]|uniref:Exonuclease domain-containing protein n=1 Tax=Rozella allomycis (strain CSF55) TaxID=988480 RepID=A0A4P9YDC7_ROZAC|nr:hypothetical protein ROZALSC1DRAFT_30771 [Rozella allomycis CSF55]
MNAASAGCDSHHHHVFKFDDPTEVSKVFKFWEVTEKDDERNDLIAIDCEMRLSVVGDDKQTIETEGSVVDYNTTYSGIDENTHKTFIPTLPPNFKGNIEKMYSFDNAIKIFDNLISPSSIIVGHSIENDLNVLRVLEIYFAY